MDERLVTQSRDGAFVDCKLKVSCIESSYLRYFHNG